MYIPTYVAGEIEYIAIEYGEGGHDKVDFNIVRFEILGIHISACGQ